MSRLPNHANYLPNAHMSTDIIGTPVSKKSGVAMVAPAAPLPMVLWCNSNVASPIAIYGQSQGLLALHSWTLLGRQCVGKISYKK